MIFGPLDFQRIRFDFGFRTFLLLNYYNSFELSLILINNSTKNNTIYQTLYYFSLQLMILQIQQKQLIRKVTVIPTWRLVQLTFGRVFVSLEQRSIHLIF